MAKDSQIRVVITGDATSIQAAFAKVETEAGKLETVVTRAGQKAAAAEGEVAAAAEEAVGPLGHLRAAGESTESALASVGKTFLLFGIASEGLSQIKEAIGSVTEAAVQEQRIEAQTAAVLRATGGAAGVTAEQVKQLGERFGQTTLYTHSQVEQGENLLLTFRSIGSDVFPQATGAMLDLATTMGGDMQGAAVMMGKALDDPVAGMTALRRAGVDFTASEKEQIKTLIQHGDLLGAQKIILQGIADQMGGTATAAGNTYQGQMAHLNDTLDKLKEAVGKEIIPYLSAFAKVLNDDLAKPGTLNWVKSFVEEIELIATGNFFTDAALQAEKFAYVLSYYFGDGLKKLTGGKIDLSPLMNDWYRQIQQWQGQIDHAIGKDIAQPIQDGLSGKDNGPLAPTQVDAAAKQVMAAYFAGFSKADFSTFDDLTKAVQTALTKGGETDPGAILDLEPTIAKAVRELREYGQVSQETEQELHDALGANVGDVDQVIAAYAQMTFAQQLAAGAADRVAGAQANLAAVTDEAAAADKAARAAVDQATATQKAHAEALKETTQALQDQITALDKQAQAAERADQDRIAGLQQGLQALQDQAQADADAFAALEKPLQDAATAAQDAATQHAGMYQAILAGDVDYYEQLIGKEDDLTAKIREKWDAEYSGLLRQKNGDDQRLFEAQAKQHQTDYELDKQILAARTAGNSAEVARLERQKALKDQQARADMQVLQDAAAVSADNEKRAHDQLDKDAKAQADQDAVKKKHADDALKAVQDQAAAKKQADDDAIKRQEAAIKEAQDQEQKDRRYWDDRKQALQDQLSAIQRNGQAQADADQRAIDAANQQKKIVDDTWNDRVQAAKDALKQAQDEQKALDDEATKQQKNLDLIKQQIAAQDQYNQKVDQTNQKLDQTNDKLKTANRQADQTDVTGTPLDQSRPANGGEAPPPALPATEGPRTSQAPQQPQVAAAAATPPQVVNFHFPNVTGALTPDTAQQAGATAAKSFAAAYRDATTSGAGRVGVNTA